MFVVTTSTFKIDFCPIFAWLLLPYQDSHIMTAIFLDNFEGVKPFFTYNSLKKEEFFGDGETLVFFNDGGLMV